MTHSPRLIVLSEFVDPAQTSTGYYWAKLISGLAQEFGQMTVICPESSYRRLGAHVPGVTYHPFRDRAFDKNRIASRLVGQCLQTLRFCGKLLSMARRGDVIFSGTNPSFAPLTIALIKSIRGCRWLLLVHDVFPENLAAANLLSRKSLLYSLLQFLFDRAYARADTVVAIGRDMAELLARKTKRPDQVAYIPNWVDPGDVIPRPRSADYLPEAWNGKVVFQFFGNLGRVQGLANLLAALPLVKHPRAAFVFIGSGSGEALIESFLREHPGLCAVRKPALSFSENNTGLAACDVAIVSLAGGMRGLAVPSKAYFSMAANRPLLVVGDPQSELHRLFEEEPSIGWYCPPDQPEALAALIDRVCDDGAGAFRGEPREVVLRRFSYVESVKAYARQLTALGIRPAVDRPTAGGCL